MPRARNLADAQHEAAHVVVGLALGLHFREARLGEQPDGAGWIEVGCTIFGGRGSHYAWALMYAAGVAWERLMGGARAAEHASGDLRALRRLGARSASAQDALTRAAGAVLWSLPGAHARVTRALLARDLEGADAERLIRGERLPL